MIEADALRPTSAYSGNLYSREYFDLLRRHLKPGGPRGPVGADPAHAGDGAERVFPHVLGFRALLIASDAPIPWDPAVVRARMQDAFTELVLPARPRRHRAPSSTEILSPAADGLRAVLRPLDDGHQPRPVPARRVPRGRELPAGGRARRERRRG